jgi:hypothetical protein
MEFASLTLTRDELLAFLVIMGVSTLNGLGDDPQAGLSEEEVEIRLNGGEESLTNRDLVTRNEQGEIVFDDMLVALVGSCIAPDATFLITRMAPDGSNEPHYFNVTPELLVEHSSPKPGVYQFDYLPDIGTLDECVQSLLADLQGSAGAAEGQVVQIASSTLGACLAAVQQGKMDEACSALSQAVISAATIELFLSDIASYPAWVSVAAWELRSPVPQGGETIMAIAGEGRAWLLESLVVPSDQVRMRQVSGSECVKALVRELEPVKQAYGLSH